MGSPRRRRLALRVDACESRMLLSTIDFRSGSIRPYGDGQDVAATVTISDDGSELGLVGNGWKKFELRHQVTSETVLEFDYRGHGGEILGIGLDNDDAISPDRTYHLGGSQNWGLRPPSGTPTAGGWTHYAIQIGENFVGDMRHLVFVADADAPGSRAEGHFANVQVFEPSTDDPPPSAVVLDNSDAGYTETGSWSNGGLAGAYGVGYRYANPGASGASAAWGFGGLASGTYELQASWTSHPNRTANARYAASGGGGVSLGSFVANQRVASTGRTDESGHAFAALGKVSVGSDGVLTVRLGSSSDGAVIADAVRLVAADSGDPGDPAPIVVSNTSEFRAALRAAGPGTHILVKPGIYQGGNYLQNFDGAEGSPIVVEAQDPANRPIIRGGTEGIKISQGSYFTLRDLIIEQTSDNGINIDDGGTYATPAHDIQLINLVFRSIGSNGNQDAIKLSGVDNFLIDGCRVESWGTGQGSGIDMVGCHDGVVSNSYFNNGGDTRGAVGIEAKGGSRDVVIRDNRFEHAGARAIQIGGLTGSSFFRPSGVNYEAKDVTVEGNVIVGSEAAIAFVGVDGSTVRFNTIYRPTRYAIRILQENTSSGMVPSRNGVFSDNIVAFRSGEMAAAVNVGSGTASSTFQFQRNWWYNIADPSRSTPSLPAAEQGGTYGVDPQFVNPGLGDFHTKPGSPAARVGAYAPR